MIEADNRLRSQEPHVCVLTAALRLAISWSHSQCDQHLLVLTLVTQLPKWHSGLQTPLRCSLSRPGLVDVVADECSSSLGKADRGLLSAKKILLRTAALSS